MYDEFFDTLPITAHSEIDVSDIVFDRAFRAGAAAGAAGAAGAPAYGVPPTVRPAVEKRAEFLAPMPLTRVIRSFQSLKAPPWVRASMIREDKPGPMPLMASRSAAEAVLTSVANALVANTKARMASSFLIMGNLLI